MHRRRRLFLAATAIASLAFPARAADPPPARIAFMAPSRAASSALRLAAFKQGMRDNGLVEGKHYIVDERYADGDYARFPALTRELLRRNPKVILVSTIESVVAAQKESKTVAIVMSPVNDPVGSGLIASLARPGGNTTGLSTQSEDTIVKYAELLREILPRAKRIAVLINPRNPSHLKMLELAAAALGSGMETRAFEAVTPGELDGQFGAISKYRPDALIVARDAMLNGEAERISKLALKNRIPTFGPTEVFSAFGSLISYSPPLADIYRHSATYVAKILAGAKPGDLPVEQPTKFEMIVNMKTARALKLMIPQSVLLRADKVIE